MPRIWPFEGWNEGIVRRSFDMTLCWRERNWNPRSPSALGTGLQATTRECELIPISMAPSVARTVNSICLPLTFVTSASPVTRASGVPLAPSSRYPDQRSSAGTNIMSERFTETLRAASEPGWSHAVGHRFVKELFTGAVPDVVMAHYLIQDHRFLDSYLTLLGGALATADTFEARLRFGRFIGLMSGEENTYFLRAFEALGVTEDRRSADPDTQPTAGFKAIMREAAQTHSYAAALSVLVVAE